MQLHRKCDSEQINMRSLYVQYLAKRLCGRRYPWYHCYQWRHQVHRPHGSWPLTASADHTTLPASVITSVPSIFTINIPLVRNKAERFDYSYDYETFSIPYIGNSTRIALLSFFWHERSKIHVTSHKGVIRLVLQYSPGGSTLQRAHILVSRMSWSKDAVLWVFHSLFCSQFKRAWLIQGWCSHSAESFINCNRKADRRQARGVLAPISCCVSYGYDIGTPSPH